MNFAETLKSAREQRGMSKSKLAKTSGLSLTAICNFELGKRATPNMESLKKLANALEIPVQTLLSEETFNDETENEETAQVIRNAIINTPDSRLQQRLDCMTAAEIECMVRVADSFMKMNQSGIIETVKRADELTYVPTYRRGSNEQ